MPDWKREVREALAGAKLKTDAAREEAVVEELAQDLADRYEDLVLQGVEEKEALRRLRGELREPGFWTELRPKLEARRDVVVTGVDKRERLLVGVQHDVRLGVRLLRSNLGFALVAILSLALGIGANTAIFELLDAVLLRTLAMRAALTDFTAPKALRSMHGICTRPPTGSQVMPRLCSMAISAACSSCSLVPSSAATSPPAAIEQATPPTRRSARRVDHLQLGALCSCWLELGKGNEKEMSMNRAEWIQHLDEVIAKRSVVHPAETRLPNSV